MLTGKCVIDCTPSEVLYCTKPFVHRGDRHKKPIPRRTPCATVTTPDEDFTSYITDTLLEREQTPGHIAR